MPPSPTCSAAWSGTSARAGRSSPRWACCFLAGTAVTYWAEGAGNPLLNALGLQGGNLEGKEIRFGIPGSALFAVVTTAASCGAVNAMHDAFTALGGLIPLVNMQLGEIIVGGVGAGLYGMLVFVVVAIFVAGLMVGRTPEYLGKKIEAREVKMAMLAILCLPLMMLGLTALATVLPAGLAGPANAGPHGFTEILYAFTSAAANNGSAFAGLSGNTPFYNLTLGAGMLVGRFFVIIPALAIAGSLAAKKTVPASAGTFPTDGGLFVGLLVGVILIVGGLTFFPSLALGPIVEHLAGRPARPSRRGADHGHHPRRPPAPGPVPAPAPLRPARRPLQLAALRHRPGAHRPRPARLRRDLGGGHARGRGFGAVKPVRANKAPPTHASS